jgi:hypothetical protein
MSRKDKILDKIENLVGNFLFYNRKEDGELPIGEIERAVESGEITIDEMVNKFREGLAGKKK